MAVKDEAQSALVEMKQGAAAAPQALHGPFLSDVDQLLEQAKHKRVQSRFHYNAIRRPKTVVGQNGDERTRAGECSFSTS